MLLCCVVLLYQIIANTPLNFWSGVPPGFPNPDPILDQITPFFIPFFRPRLPIWSRKSCCFVPNDFLVTSLSLFFVWSCKKKYIWRSRGSLENYTQFQTKMVKICTRFQTKTAQKPYPLGQHMPIAHTLEYSHSGVQTPNFSWGEGRLYTSYISVSLVTITRMFTRGLWCLNWYISFSRLIVTSKLIIIIVRQGGYYCENLTYFNWMISCSRALTLGNFAFFFSVIRNPTLKNANLFRARTLNFLNPWITTLNLWLLKYIGKALF